MLLLIIFQIKIKIGVVLFLPSTLIFFLLIFTSHFLSTYLFPYSSLLIFCTNVFAPKSRFLNSKIRKLSFQRWLRDHSICLSETTNLLECRVSDDDIHNGNIVLFYALHCGHAIYNSVIYAHRKKLKRIIIAGKQFNLAHLSLRVFCGSKVFSMLPDKFISEFQVTIFV